MLLILNCLNASIASPATKSVELTGSGIITALYVKTILFVAEPPYLISGRVSDSP